jgi:hypothetical protein
MSYGLWPFKGAEKVKAQLEKELSNQVVLFLSPYSLFLFEAGGFKKLILTRV